MIFTQELSEGDETVKAPRRPAKAWKLSHVSKTGQPIVIVGRRGWGELDAGLRVQS